MKGRYFQAVKPLLMLLSVVGLFVPKVRSRSCCEILTSVVACFLWLLGVASSVHRLYEFVLRFGSHDKPEQRTLGAVSVLCVAFHLAYNLAIFVLLTGNVSMALPRFIKAVDGYLIRYEICPGKKIFCFFTAAVYSVFIFYITVSVYSYVVSDQGLACPSSGSYNESDIELRSLFQLTLSILSYHFVMSAFCSPALVYLLVWLTLFTEAKRFNQQFDHFQREPSAEPFQPIEDFRLRHTALCELIGRGNDVMRVFLLLAYGGGVPIMLVSLRVLIYEDAEDGMSRYAVCMMVDMCLQLAVVTVTGAALHAQVSDTYCLSASLSVRASSSSRFLSCVTMGVEIKTPPPPPPPPPHFGGLGLSKFHLSKHPME